MAPMAMCHFDEPGAEQWHDCHRDEIGGSQRQNYTERQSRKQILADAVQEDHGKEDNRGSEGGSQHRKLDLLAALLARGKGVLPLLQVPEDVLQHHYRVVNQARQDQGQSTQHHGVDGPSDCVQQQEAGQAGDWYRDQDRDGSAYRAQEDQDHYRSQNQADAALAQHIGHSGLYILRLVEDHIGYQRGGNVEQMLHPVSHAVHNCDGVTAAALLQDGQIDGFLSVHANDVVLDGGRIFGVPNVSEAKHTVADGLQWDIIHLRYVGQLGVAVDVVISGPNADVACRQDLVGAVDDIDHIHRAHLRGLQLDRIDIELDLAILAAIGLRHGRTGHVGNLVANRELSLVMQLRFVQPLTFQRYQADGHAGGIKLQHHRRQGALRQSPQVGHREVGDFTHGRIRVGTGLKVDLDEAYPGQGARLDVVDIAAQSKESFEGIGDVGLNLLRRHAAVERGHHHDWNVDGRKQINRHAGDRCHANHNDGEAQHENEERILDRETRHWSSLRIRAFGGERSFFWLY